MTRSAEAFHQAFKINPKDSNAAVGQAQAIDAATNAHLGKAGNYLENNQYSEAISEWEKVLKYQPDNQQVKGFIATAKSKLDSEVEDHYSLGESFAQKGGIPKSFERMEPGIANGSKQSQNTKGH